jgi:hypothetical protein
LQTAVGWHDRETRTKSEDHLVRLTSKPEGVEVVRRAPDGKEVSLGVTPVVDRIPIQIEETIESPNFGALFIGAVLEGAGTVGLVMLGREAEDAGKIAIFSTAGLFAYLTLQELVVALIHGGSSDSIVGRKQVGGSQNYLYAGRKAGLPDGLAIVRVPDQGKAELILDTKTTVTQVEVPKKLEEQKKDEPAKEPAKSGFANAVVAVMNVEDINADLPDRAIDPSVLLNLGDQLRIFVAQRGVRTIDRGAQDQVLKEQISEVKKESYQECYDDSCQIELGKALAASHILRSRITRFGARCVLNAEVIDLRVEVTVTAASAQGDCEAEGFLAMSEAVANSLFTN